MCTVNPDVKTNRLSFLLWLATLTHKRITGLLALLICHNTMLPAYAADSTSVTSRMNEMMEHRRSVSLDGTKSASEKHSDKVDGNQIFHSGNDKTSLQPNVSPSPNVVTLAQHEEDGVFGSIKKRASKLPPMNPPTLNSTSTPTQQGMAPAQPTTIPASSPAAKEVGESKTAPTNTVSKHDTHATNTQAQKTASTRRHGFLKRPSASPKASEADTESEVINNILGAPVLTTPKPPATDKDAKPATTDSKAPDATTSIPNAASTTTETPAFPEPSNFDYGIYTYNCHLLDDYVQRVRNNLQLAQELGFSRPKKQIEDLLKTTAEQRRVFTDKYPSPKQDESEKGLQAYDVARQAVLEALSLATVSPRVEGRAIWLDRASIVQAANPAGLKALMGRMHQAGINIIYFETVNAGFPIYPSKITQPNPLIHDWDPLAVAVEEGHRLGMEVHAWVWCFAVGNRRHNELIGQPETYPGPILNEPSLMTEALRNRHGGLAVDGRQHEFWLSPASSKAKGFLISLYSEIVSNYAVDGLHLDYIRYPFQTSATRMGYEVPGRLAYHATTGKSVDDTGTDSMRLWAAWKTVQVSNFVRDISTTLRPLRPGLKISAAVFPMRRAARLAAIQQDWETWLEQGWVDTLSPMSYTSDPQRLKTLYESVINSPQLHSIVYPGIALSHLDSGQLLLQLEALREDGSLGSTLFAATHLSTDKVTSLSSGPYRQNKALVPHRDILKSIATVFEEYQDTISRLSASKSTGTAPNLDISDESFHALKRSMDAFSVSLAKLQSFVQASTTDSPQHATKEERVGDALYNMSALQQTHSIALEGDHRLHPQRAQYMDRTLEQLKNLLLIYSDHLLSAPATIETAQNHHYAPVTVNSAFNVLAHPNSTIQMQKSSSTLAAPVTTTPGTTTQVLSHPPAVLPSASVENNSVKN